jgi:TolB-like protein/Flp pilus assembly protein TadD
VLPFDNLSGEDKYERLADGITEDIITDLSRFRELFVIARNSTFFYKSKPTDVRQIARELGVQYVLEGSLQSDSEQVRITAQLVDATTGNHVWSDRYDRPLRDVFAIQDEVTKAITGQLGGLDSPIARAGRDLARRKPPENLQAYDYYLLGIETKELFTRENNKKAQALFHKALDLDPNFARAYIGLAHTYNMEIDMGFGDSYKESMNNWRNATEKAIALDPYDGEARLLLGWYYQFLNDYDRTVAELDRAIELNPNNADVLGLAALLLTKSGQPERALHLAEQSIRLNPHHPDWYYGPLRDSYFYSGRFEEAIAATRKRLHPNPVYDPLVRAMSYAQLGRAQEASHEVATLLEANPDYSAEKFLSETGTFARDLDLNRFLDSHRKAGLPLCATEAQLAKYPDMKRLEQCEAQRASG